jgi:ABC-type dipeptide/oligopeptide/nickel transport system permease subunit
MLRRLDDNPLWRELRLSRIAQVSFALTLVYFVAAALGPMLAPYSPIDMLTLPRQGPSAQHWFGTDEIGRDIFSRLLVSARVAITVGFVAVAIGIGGIPGYAPLVRGEVLSLLERDYVAAARALGAHHLRVVGKHLAPLMVSSLLVYSTAQLARAILAEAGLSYLGLGVQPPNPSWGGMISSGQRFFLSAPFMAIYPGVAIMILVFALNLLGDAFRDALNPQLRRGGSK